MSALRVLDARAPEDRIRWLRILEAFPTREIFAHRGAVVV